MAHTEGLYRTEGYLGTAAQSEELVETPRVIRNFVETGNWVSSQFLEHCINRIRAEIAAVENKVFEAINEVQDTVFSSPQAENPHETGSGKAAHELQSLRAELVHHKEQFAYLHTSVKELAEELHRVKTGKSAAPTAKVMPEVKCVTAIRRTVKDNLDVSAMPEVGKTLTLETAQYLLYFRQLVDSGFVQIDAGAVKVRIPQTASATKGK